MAVAIDSKPADGTAGSARSSMAMEPLIDLLSSDLKGAVARERVAHIVVDVLARYRDARVTSYLSIIVRRNALERLRAECSQVARDR